MKKFKAFWKWAAHRPTVIVNIIGLLIIIVGGGAFFLHELNKPIDVLTDWKVSTSKSIVNGKLPEYNPGGTLEYISSANKLISADGNMTRTFKCDAIPGIAPARDIRLPQTPATRAPGVSEPSEISVVIPSIVEFNGLPRTCRLQFDICYNDVVLWRDHCETNRTNDFIVKIQEFDVKQLREQISELNRKTEELQRQIDERNGIESAPQTQSNNQSSTTQPRTDTQSTTNNTTTNNTTTNNTTNNPPADDGFQLKDLPIIGGLFQ